MMALLGVIFIIAVGCGVIRFAGVKTGWAESIALGWLVGAVVTTFMIFWIGMAGWMAFLYLALCGSVIWFVKRGAESPTNHYVPENRSSLSNKELMPRGLSKFIPLLWALLATQLIYGVYGVFNLPTRYWDSFDGWHIRARIFVEEVTFGPGADALFLYGGKNLHYPMHMPLLKAFLCRLAGGWSDSIALGVDIIGFIAFLVVVYHALKLFCGKGAAVVGIYFVSSIPFIGIHLSAGYSDLTVAIYLAASVIYWQRWRLGGGVGRLVISGLLISAAAWTKNDAMILYLPVIMLATLMAGRWQGIKVFLSSTILLLIPWFLLKQSLGHSFAPNQGVGEETIVFHPLALQIFPFSIYEYGSFSIFWILLLTLVFFRCKSSATKSLWLIGWGCLLSVLLVFTFTPAFKFLINNMTFQRSLLQVFPLLAIASITRVCDILKERQSE